ncbi:MAG: Ig-like domain-containing protein [Fermentimonas sp.]|jgi:hypothetical protein
MKMRKAQFIYVLIVAALTLGLSACDNKDDDLGVKGITLNKTALTLKIGTEETLTYKIFPENANNKNVTWKSSDENVATVNNGTVKAIKPGTAIISVTTAENSETAQCEITVTASDPKSVKGDVDGVWTKYSVINVDGHIKVPKGKSLTIEEGVEIIITDAGVDANDTKVEVLVDGNLYVRGTEEAPVLFSVAPSKRTKENTFGRLWGGIIGSTTCEEILIDHAIIEYTGAETSKTSPSVINGLFKPAGGEGMVAFNTNNTNGRYVITNTIFRNTGEDAIYVQGGKCIFTNNLFYAVGDTGGEAINVKAGCQVDAAYNVMYSPNTNAFKLSSSGQDPQRHQALIKAYNNTIINAGWGRDPDKPKGGSIWLEKSALVEVYNNLIVNSMFAVRSSPDDAQDKASVVDYNFYASGEQKSTIPQHIANGTVTAFDGFKDDGVKDLIIGAHDIRGNAPGDKDPKFVNFPFNTNSLNSRTNFDNNWDFHLQAGSPALTGAKTDIKPYFAEKGVTVGGKEYKSPKAASHFGAFGAK